MQVIFRMIIMRSMTFYYCSFKRFFAHSQYTIQLWVKKTLSASECDSLFLILKRVTNPAINDIIHISEFFKRGDDLRKYKYSNIVLGAVVRVGILSHICMFQKWF